MLLTCENCETIFRIESSQLSTPGQQVRCSVCQHVWAPDVGEEEASETPLLRDSVSVLRAPLILCALAIFFVSLISFNRGLITSYLPSTIQLFDMSGLEIRPDISKLEVQGLKANFAGDTLRISGFLANTSQWRTHAAPLRLTIADDDGVVLHTQRILPTDAFIDGKDMTDFFIQLTVEDTTKAEIRVEPLAIRLAPNTAS